MANLKFYKKATAPVGTTEKPIEAGAIWFNTTNHTIEVFTGSKWEVFTGAINAVVEGEKLTITNYDGSKASVDFSVYATDEALNLLAGRVGTLETTVQTHGSNISDLQGRMNTVEGKVATAEGQLAGLTEATVMLEIAKQVKVADDRAVAKENELAGKISALETTVNTDHEGRIDALEAKFTGEGSVADQIADAVEAAEGRVQAKLDKKVETSAYNEYTTANDARVKAVEDNLGAEITRATAAEEAIQKQIGTGFSETATVAAAVKSAQDAADAAQKTIDDFLKGEGVDPNKVDALKDIIDYMTEHGEDYQAVVDNLDALNTDVATLKGDAETVGSVAKAVADAEGRINATIEANEEVTAKALTELDGRVDALEAISAGTEIDGIKDRLEALETEVSTNIPQDIADAQAAAEATAAADATAKANAAEAAAKSHAETKASEAQAAAEATAAAALAVEAAKVAANTAAIAALDAKVDAGLAWVEFE